MPEDECRFASGARRKITIDERLFLESSFHRRLYRYRITTVELPVFAAGFSGPLVYLGFLL